MRELLTERLQTAIAERIFPGCVVGIIKKSGERFVLPFGRLTYESDADLVVTDTVYDCASVTKSIPLALLILQLVDQGKLSIDDRVVEYVPAFGTDELKKKVTIKHLLTYTVDFDLPALSTFALLSSDEIIDRVVGARLRRAPGTSFAYVNPTALLLGRVLEQVTSETLPYRAVRELFEPLGMSNSTFDTSTLVRPSVAEAEKGSPVGIVHDEVTRKLQSEGYFLGAAGLFSTADDLLNVLEMLLNKGEWRGKRFLSETLVDAISFDYAPELEERTGLGFELNWNETLGRKCSEKAFGKTGFTGASVFVDPERDVAMTLVSNRTYPKRPETRAAIRAVRKDLVDIVCIDAGA